MLGSASKGTSTSRYPAAASRDGADLFSMLCPSESEDGERFTDQDIVNHMIFLLMAAHDTTAIALSMLIYELGRNEHWQNTLRAEAIQRPSSRLP